MTLTTAHIVWTIVLLVLFIGIVAWAWSAKRKPAFEEAAHIPLDEDRPAAPPEKNNV